MTDLFKYATDPNLLLGAATLSAVSNGPGGFNFLQAIFKQYFLSSVHISASVGDDFPSVSASMATGDVTLRYRKTEKDIWAEARFVLPKDGGLAVFSGDPMAFEGLRLAMSPAVAVPEPASSTVKLHLR